jgi:anti-anti-sigma factor
MLTAEHYHEALIAPPRLDAASRLSFRRAALEHLERITQRSETHFVIDLQHTIDIDASGLGVLVLIQKRARERMVATKLLHAPPSVKQMIALTRLEYLFEFGD